MGNKGSKKTADTAQENSNDSKQQTNQQTGAQNEQTKQTKQTLSNKDISNKDSDNESLKNNEINGDGDDDDDDSTTQKAVNWQAGAPLEIFSNVYQEWFPGYIESISINPTQNTQVCVVIVWELQYCDVRKVQIPYNSEAIRPRQIKSSNGMDEWILPNENDIIRMRLYSTLVNEIDCITNEQDAMAFWRAFRKFLIQKRQWQNQNPYVQLIGAYLAENAVGWKSIFAKYVNLIKLFQKNENLNEKSEILFDIINIKSNAIDNEAFRMLSLLYAKTIIPNDKDNAIQKQKQRADYLIKVFIKETKGEPVTFDMFKQLVENTKIKTALGSSVDKIHSLAKTVLLYDSVHKFKRNFIS